MPRRLTDIRPVINPGESVLRILLASSLSALGTFPESKLCKEPGRFVIIPDMGRAPIPGECPPFI